MWIDADAHFYIDNPISIINFINNNNNYNFIFSKDIYTSPLSLNTGCLIVKNTQYSIDFLTKWGYDEILYKNNTFPSYWDQGVLIDMYKQNMLDIKNNSIAVDYGILQHFYEEELLKLPYKPFIIHLAGRNTQIRYKHSLDYITKYNIYLCNRNPICNRKITKKQLKKHNLNKMLFI